MREAFAVLRKTLCLANLKDCSFLFFIFLVGEHLLVGVTYIYIPLKQGESNLLKCMKRKLEGHAKHRAVDAVHVIVLRRSGII